MMVCLSQQKDYTTVSFPDTDDFCLSKQKELLHTTSKISTISVHPRSKTLVVTTLKHKHTHKKRKENQLMDQHHITEGYLIVASRKDISPGHQWSQTANLRHLPFLSCLHLDRTNKPHTCSQRKTMTVYLATVGDFPSALLLSTVKTLQ